MWFLWQLLNSTIIAEMQTLATYKQKDKVVFNNTLFTKKKKKAPGKFGLPVLVFQSLSEMMSKYYILNQEENPQNGRKSLQMKQLTRD